MAKTPSTTAPEAGTDPVDETASVPTGRQTRDEDRKQLPNGQPNKSPSGDLPDPVEQEAGIKPLKAVHQITYGANKTAVPGSVFVPVSAAERKELLTGEFPAAEEPNKAELALFADEEASDFA